MVAGLIAYQVSSAAQFLSGSTSKRIPYEVVHCLRLALADWTTDKVTITTALSPDLESGFYFLGVPIQFYVLAEGYLGVKFDSELVQISLPQIYRHRPLYNIPLYHELGHFIDLRSNVSGLTLITIPATGPLEVARSHRHEHFADLFCACYMGKVATSFLVDFAGMQGASDTHPATADRVRVVDDFIDGKPNSTVTMFQNALQQLGLPALSQRFGKPPVAAFFDNVCPCKLGDSADVHGLLSGGYTYLTQAISSKPAQWSALPDDRLESVVNDLTEKSIRNFMIRSRWDTAAARP